MYRLLALASAAALLTACAALGRSDSAGVDSGGYASPTGAAFMGYHGPIERLNKTDD
jgi:hypothetical protein